MHTKNKRQVYIWQENMDFFNELKNKSRVINLLLKKYQEELQDEDESGTESR